MRFWIEEWCVEYFQNPNTMKIIGDGQTKYESTQKLSVICKLAEFQVLLISKLGPYQRDQHHL